MRTKIALSALAIVPVLGAVASADSLGVISYEYVNIRVNPSMNDAVKFVLKKNDKVQILSEKNGWVNIKVNNKNGWVQSSAISKTQPLNNVKKSSKRKAMYVNSDVLNFRTAPSTASKVTAVLHKGDKVTVLEESAGWSKVDYNGQVGYLSTSFLSENDGSKSNSIKLVTSNNLNARRKSDISSEKVFSLRKGDKVQYLSEKNGWTKVKFDGKLGYVSSYYLEDSISDIDEETVPDVVDNKSPDKMSAHVGVKYVDMKTSLSDFADMQLAMSLNVNANKGWSKATKDELMGYMDPNNHQDDASMMQFVVLNQYTNVISASQLNSYLNKVTKPGNVFYNQGAAFINAAKKYNINVLYLVAHSLIETGNGSSKLAKGVLCNGKTVYNFFGIGAVDGNALSGGANTAYKNGWTSVAAGIDGAARWIASRYIHHSQYGQNTLYSMKWSKDYIWHQYASDITWPSQIGKKMNMIAQYSNDAGNLSYLVPRYN